MKRCNTISLFGNAASNTGDSFSYLVLLLRFAILLLDFIHVVYHHLKNFVKASRPLPLILRILKFLL